jgi:hypothetical protein
MLWFHKLLAILLLSFGAALMGLTFPIPVLAKLLGTAGFALGSWRIWIAYRRALTRSGIAISSVGFMVFCDLILLAGGGYFVVVAIDSAWVGLFERPSLIGLEPEWPWTTPITGLHFISWPAVVIALPGLTLWFTSLSSQRIRVDVGGVTSLGAAGSRFISWQDLERVSVHSQQNPFSFTVMDFRGLQRVLILEGGNRSLTINEASDTRKHLIIQELKAYVPDTKRHLLENLSNW